MGAGQALPIAQCPQATRGAARPDDQPAYTRHRSAQPSPGAGGRYPGRQRAPCLAGQGDTAASRLAGAGATAADGAGATASSNDDELMAMGSAPAGSEVVIDGAATASSNAVRHGPLGRAGRGLTSAELCAGAPLMAIENSDSTSPKNYEHGRPGFPAHLYTILRPAGKPVAAAAAGPRPVAGRLREEVL